MKVTGIRTTPFAYRRPRPIGDANLAEGNSWMSFVAVEVDTDEGIVGSAFGLAGCEQMVAALAEVVIGEEPARVRGLWERMTSVLFKRGLGGSSGHALSAIDIALWDLKAKERGEPLWRTLGAAGEPVGAYASGIDMPLGDGELRSYYDEMGALGFTAGKLKVGHDPAADLRRLEIMDEALRGRTGQATLLIDANEFWSAKQAIRRVSEIEERFDLAWVEEPVDRTDLRGLRQVSDAVRAAVATGENLADPREFLPLIQAGAVDVVEPNPTVAGITGVLQVAELAHAHNLPIAMMNCPGHVLAHVAALFPTHWMMEVIDVQEAAVIRSSMRIVDGRIHLSDEPGHGLSFDPDELARHREMVLLAFDEAVPYLRHPQARRHEAGQRKRS
jgi:L-alanine-DL-glutamate epimerase-like enolase superfamily enzyme